MADSPSTTNYFQGAGFLKWTPTGGVQRDLGNIVECVLTPSATKKEHKTARNGSAKTDMTQYPNKAMTIKLTLDEITPENLAMMMMSDVVDNMDGSKTIRLMSVSTITGALEFTGTNDEGNVVDGNFPSVSFGPSGSFTPVTTKGDDWAELEITGDLLAIEATDGSSDFGQMTVTEAA